MVNTFLPYPDFRKSVASLDNKRLGKQRVEAKQIIDAIATGTRWQNHPACIMWMENIEALAYYYNCCLDEWISRGKNNTMPYYEIDCRYSHCEKSSPHTHDQSCFDIPWWVGWNHFHYSHQASLTRKFPDYYKFDIPEYYINRGYVWPSKLEPEWKDYYDIIPDESLEEEVKLNLEFIFAPVSQLRRTREETRSDLYTVAELRAMAKEQDYSGYSKLKKLELIELLGLFE